MPGLFKVGQTSRSPYQRVVELSATSGVPQDIFLVVAVFVKDRRAAELRMHAALAGTRVSGDREFFRFDGPEEARTAFVLALASSADVDDLGQDFGYAALIREINRQKIRASSYEAEAACLEETVHDLTDRLKRIKQSISKFARIDMELTAACARIAELDHELQWSIQARAQLQRELDASEARSRECELIMKRHRYLLQLSASAAHPAIRACLEGLTDPG